MKSIKPSEIGISKIKLARQKIAVERHWARDNEEWLKEASLVAEPNNPNSLYLAPGISYGTWNRFLSGKPVNPKAFKAYCTILGLNWREIASIPFTSPIFKAREAKRCDWSEAPDATFYGRSQELSVLKTQIVNDRCRCVAIVGMGGIGKTALASALAKQIQGEFEFVIWRSLRQAPDLKEVLSALIQRLSPEQELEPNLATLLDCLRKHRCLLILDNVESVMASCAETLEQSAGYYRQGYEGYAELLTRVGETSHQSCLVLTSREKPREIEKLEGNTRLVRVLQLSGLNEQDSAQILVENRAFFGSQRELKFMTSYYSGHPLALKTANLAITEIVDGDITEFVQEFLIKEEIFFDNIESLLDQQFNRLSRLEQEIMCCLALSSTPIAAAELLEASFLIASRQVLIEALLSLRRRSLIEKSSHGFSQQPMVTKYVTHRLVEHLSSYM